MRWGSSNNAVTEAAPAQGWPTRPEQVAAGDIGYRCRQLEIAADAFADLQRELRALRERLACYEALARSVDPDMDLHELAAASAGVDLMQRVLERRRDSFSRLEERHRSAEAALGRAWNRMLAIQRQLTGTIDEKGRDGYLRSRAALESELTDLLGFLPG